ncbi:MAG: RagB/SusD family nutrient uptake outer membrane protein, partial [Muribaculaceae bacterium]|nr:RagB/SusD family nutrient uptake outer membrane protein [Muribaculaceae bacterium]
SDLDRALALVESSGLTPQEVLSSGPKRFLGTAAIHGLRARVYLVMGKYKEAAEEATAAINTNGVAPYSIEAVSVPTFNSADASSWLWCIHLGENDRVVTSGIVNWASHMGSLNYGYATYGGWRSISATLYASIPATDVRKGWFLNAYGESANLSAAQQRFLTGRGAPEYAQVKFAPYQDVLNTTVNAAPIPLMRVEEMYLILAEAQAMDGQPSTGAETLTDFVQTYRDPEYTCTATDADGVREAVWNQRRIELWGEGLSYFDLVRLNKPVDRRGGGWDESWVYNIPAGDQIMVLPIPQSETNRNPLISPADNNPSVSKPRPVDDY